jgi:hypothetical protein
MIARAALALLAAAAALAPGALAQEARKKQEIIFPVIAPRTVDAPPFTIAARATSGLAVSLELVSGPAVLEKRVLRLTGQPGLVLIRASQGGDAVFAPAAPVDQLLEVLPRPFAPVIVTQPAGAYAEIGGSVALSVAARGEPAPGFQWRKDGVTITGATRATFAIASAALSDSGAYDVIATNPSGSASSSAARVAIVKRHQAISFRPSGPVAPGQQITLSATASSGLPVRYEILSGQGTLNGDLLSSPGGTVTVRAVQPGDASFDAAVPETQMFVFAGLGQQIP